MDNTKLIYKKGLGSLPVHNPPERVWERIETSLFAIDPSALPVYAPSPGTWAVIHRSMLVKKQLKRTAIFLLILASIATTGYFINDSLKNKPVNNSIVVEETYNSPPITTGPDINKEPRAAFAGGVSGPAQQTPGSASPGMPSHITGPEDAAQLAAPIHNTASTNLSEMISIGKAEMRKACIIAQGSHMIRERDRNDQCSYFTGRSSEFSWGGGYEYQHFLSGNKYGQYEQRAWHGAGLHARLHFGKLFIESGLGLSFIRGSRDYTYDFLRNELVNTYEYVDSVYYDPVTGETIHYTTTVEVYDSLQHSRTSSVNSNDIYLHLPFIVGIKLFSKSDFCSHISAGVSYYALIKRSEITIRPQEANSRILNIYDKPVYRTDHLFNASLRLEFEWKLNERFGLFACPAANYYLNTLFEDQNGSGPLSIGVGIGLNIK